jgi:hypothetical protein
MSEFQEMVAQKLGWRNLNLRDHSKVTQNRPRLAAMDDATKTSILRGNQLDSQLYRFAQELFASRMDRFNIR